ncbi:uncharacterized protein RCH25_018288 [Pelodytes ibericus]
MDVTRFLLVFWSLQGRVQSNQDKTYCSHQIESIQVEVGDTVIIPCWLSYPKDWEQSSSEIRVYWRSGITSPCWSNPFIYNHTEHWTHTDYTGWISMVRKPNELKTASITIQGLRRTDGPIFCCWVKLNSYNNWKKQQWQNCHATYLRFPDEIWVDQLDAVPALPGENITIPCYIHHPPGIQKAVTRVTWRKGSSDVCSQNPILVYVWGNAFKSGRLSVMNFPDDISLRIEGGSSSDKSQYCCEVIIDGYIYRSIHGTELPVEDSTSPPGFNVVQSLEASAQLGGSVTISCSFNYSKDTDPLSVGIYWRVGSPTGYYTYHPSQKMVHSSYKNRTDLQNRQTDLHIQDVQETDNITYYCLVMLRFCAGLNKVSSVVMHGPGTRLHVTATPNNSQLNLCSETLADGAE